MSSNTPVLRLEAVTKSFSGKKAVDLLNLSIEAGEIYVFLGPNGAGKTTTMKIAVGLIRPEHGNVSILGKSVQSFVGHGTPVPFSYIPEEPHLYERLTAREFFHFIGETAGISKSLVSERVQDYGQRLGVMDFIDDAAITYSHGMRQRVAVTGALISKPTLLVIDEPLVGLDPTTAIALKAILRELAAEGSSILLSTHTLPIAEELADRIGVMNLGRIVAEGPPASLATKGETLEQAFMRLTRA